LGIVWVWEEIKKGRGNVENLKPITKRTKDEARKISQKGGKRSGEVRRERKAMRESLLALLQTQTTQGATYQDEIEIALINQALKGNVKAFEVIRDTIGEKPIDKQSVDMGIRDTDIKVEFVDKAYRAKSPQDPKIVGDWPLEEGDNGKDGERK